MKVLHSMARGLNTADAAQYIGFSAGFLRKARRGKTKVSGPKFRRIGNRVIYVRAELDIFLDQYPDVSPLDASRSGGSE